MYNLPNEILFQIISIENFFVFVCVCHKFNAITKSFLKKSIPENFSITVIVYYLRKLVSGEYLVSADDAVIRMIGKLSQQLALIPSLKNLSVYNDIVHIESSVDYGGVHPFNYFHSYERVKECALAASDYRDVKKYFYNEEVLSKLKFFIRITAENIMEVSDAFSRVHHFGNIEVMIAEEYFELFITLVLKKILHIGGDCKPYKKDRIKITTEKEFISLRQFLM